VIHRFAPRSAESHPCGRCAGPAVRSLSMPAAAAGNVNVQMAVADLDAIRERRSEILDRASQHGARNVRVFGSAARGDAGPASDVDLLVEMEPGRSLLDFVGLWQELEDLLGLKVDLVSDRGISPYLREQILSEAIAL
jgi:predicted nucleotidyltransferase